MEILLSIIIAIVCSYLAIVTLDIEKAKKYKFFYSQENDECEKISLKKRTIWGSTVLIFLVAFLTSLKILTEVTDVLNVCKMLIALVILTGSACFDFREHRIPNIFPLMLSISGVVFLILGIVIKQNGAMSYVVSSAFATFGCVIGLMVAAALTNNGIGAGDVKLMGALALLGGVYLVCGVLCFSVFACAIVAVFLLLLKKKTLKEAVPFGPFILIGFVISIFLSIF